MFALDRLKSFTFHRSGSIQAKESQVHGVEEHFQQIQQPRPLAEHEDSMALGLAGTRTKYSHSINDAAAAISSNVNIIHEENGMDGQWTHH